MAWMHAFLHVGMHSCRQAGRRSTSKGQLVIIQFFYLIVELHCKSSLCNFLWFVVHIRMPYMQQISRYATHFNWFWSRHAPCMYSNPSNMIRIWYKQLFFIPSLWKNTSFCFIVKHGVAWHCMEVCILCMHFLFANVSQAITIIFAFICAISSIIKICLFFVFLHLCLFLLFHMQHEC